MVSRRELLGGSVMAGLAGSSAEAAMQGVNPEEMRRITTRLEDIGGALRTLGDGNSLPSTSITRLRDTMGIFLRANAKFPDYLEVGIAVFFDVYDWHVKNQREIVAGRQPDGRYALQFMFTRLLLRFENEPNFVGYPYDTR